MLTTRSSFALLAAVASVAMFQEPAPRPAQDPTPKHVAAAPERHPLEGVYELRRRMVAGRFEARPSRGYVAITHRHLFVCLAGPGSDDDHPLLRAGVRTWAQKNDALESVVEVGWFTDAKGEVHVEVPGTKETRTISIERGILRIHQDAQNLLEFERVE